MIQATNQLIELLPYRMRDRVRGYIDFVDSVLSEVLLEQNLEERRTDFQETIEMIFFVRFLYSFINVGYDNYEKTLGSLGAKGARGFRVGSSNYGSQTLIDQEWRTLRNELNLIINQITNIQFDATPTRQGNLPIGRYARLDSSVRSIIEDIVEQMR